MKAAIALSPPRSHKQAKSFPRLWQFALEYLVALPLGALIALVWANTNAETYYRFVDSSAFLVNDIAMVVFFALITKEIVEAAAPGGVLHPWHRVAMAVVAAAGVAFLPVALFSVLVRYFDEPMLVRGWTTMMAVDMALGYFVARVIFGRQPAIPFFLLLAISANGLGFIALAIADPIHDIRLDLAVPLMVAALVTALALRRLHVKSLWPYVLLGGGFSWTALFVGGFHPALALVPIVPFLPHAPRDPGFFVDAEPNAPDALNRLELLCRHPAQAALFFFGLVNAGLPLNALEHGFWSIPLASVIAKPVGLLAGVAVGTAAGLHLPRGVHWRDLIPIGLVTSIGFTMSLFFATATVGTGQLLAELKMGALVGISGGVLAIAAAWMLGAGRFKGSSRSRVH
jgi:Na+:H+ antiporter, NhaA family